MQSINQDQVAGLPGALAAAGGPGMQYGPRTAYTSTGTKTVATETPWIPPTGMALWGFRVIAIGAGGGAPINGQGGGGGNRLDRTVSLESMGNPSTIPITVGAGVDASNGGTSSFGSWVVALGGGVGGVPVHPDEPAANFSQPDGQAGDYFTSNGAANGANAPAGLRGGGGCAYDGQYGGSAYPRFSTTRRSQSSGNTAASSMSQPPYRASSGNPTRQDGVGDWCGDGGDYQQNGYFPGGGAGAGYDFQRRGGHGVVIVYPIFRKA